MSETAENGDDAGAIRRLLENAAKLVGQRDVTLQCDTDILETVYVEVNLGGVVVHDRGKTFGYMARGTDKTYVP